MGSCTKRSALIWAVWNPGMSVELLRFNVGLGEGIVDLLSWDLLRLPDLDPNASHGHSLRVECIGTPWKFCFVSLLVLSEIFWTTSNEGNHFWISPYYSRSTMRQVWPQSRPLWMKLNNIARCFEPMPGQILLDIPDSGRLALAGVRKTCCKCPCSWH